MQPEQNSAQDLNSVFVQPELSSCVVCGNPASIRAASCRNCSEPDPAHLKDDPEHRTKEQKAFDDRRAELLQAEAARKEAALLEALRPQKSNEDIAKEKQDEIRKTQALVREWNKHKIIYHAGNLVQKTGILTGIFSIAMGLITEKYGAGAGLALASFGVAAGGFLTKVHAATSGKYMPPRVRTDWRGRGDGLREVKIYEERRPLDFDP